MYFLDSKNHEFLNYSDQEVPKFYSKLVKQRAVLG